jgi:hypothetical protein
MILKMESVADRGIGPFCSLASGVRKNKYRIDHRQARVGKWETWFWFSTFPLGLARAVGMWGSRVVCEISKELWEGWEACLWLSTPSIAPAFPQPAVASVHENRGGTGHSVLHRRSSLAFAAPIFLAHSVSLITFANLSNCAKLMLSFKYCWAPGKALRFS